VVVEVSELMLLFVAWTKAWANVARCTPVPQNATHALSEVIEPPQGCSCEHVDVFYNYLHAMCLGGEFGHVPVRDV
jgi:hypothetical protein